jgi:uroporphyrinogen decarboxylase
MTSRERFLRTMRYGRPDRVPYLEEGLRDDVLDRWRVEGLPANADLSAMFHTDRREQIELVLEPLPRSRTLPASRRGLRTLRERLNPADPARFPKDWPARVKAWKSRKHILEMRISHGFFRTLGADTWSGFARVMYLLSDAPELVREATRIQGEFAARLADRVLQEVDLDLIIFSEPIGGNEGPLLSPRQYEEFVLSGYRPALDVVKRRGVPAICLLTYANCRALLPGIVKAGFNCLWACEVNNDAMDYRDIRREFGRDLRLIGGIDLDALSAGKDAIRREMLPKIAPLLADGGYIPLADGRVRANVSFENYACYRRLMEKLTQR